MPLHQWHQLCCTCSLAVCVATRGCEHLSQVFARKLRPKPDLLSHGQSVFATLSTDNGGIFHGISASNKNLKIQKLSKLTIRLVRSTCLLALFMFGWIPLGSETRSVNSQLWPSKGPSLVWPHQEGGDTSQGKCWWEKASRTLLETGRVWGV